MSNSVNSTAADDRRSRIKRLLAFYPHIAEEELQDLLGWFRKEATALDVGLLASEPGLCKQYQRLKADHLDRTSGANLFWTGTTLILLVMVIGLLAWGSF